MRTGSSIATGWVVGLIGALLLGIVFWLSSRYVFVDVGLISSDLIHEETPGEIILPEWSVGLIFSAVGALVAAMIWEYLILRQENGASRRARRERNRIESQLRAFMNETPSAISIRDPDGRYIYVNAAWENWAQLSAAQVLGRNIAEFPERFNKSSLARDAREFEKTLQSGSVRRYESTGIAFDGKPSSAHIVRFPIRDEDGVISSVATIVTDLTYQRRLSSSQRTLQAQLRAFIDNGPFLVSMRDLDGRYVLCNRAWEQWFGVTEKDAQGKAPWELFDDPTGEMLDEVGSPFAHRSIVGSDGSIEAWTPMLCERMHRRPSGELVPMASMHFPIRDADGHVIAVGSVSRDVTDRWELQQKKDELQAQLKAFLDHAPIGVMLRQANGGRVLANPAFDHMFCKDIGGSSAHPGIDAGLLAEIDALDEEVIANGEVIRREFDPSPSDSGEISVSAIKFPLKNAEGNVVAVGTFLRDETEQRAARRFLEDSEARYRSMVELSPNPILVYDGQRILFANETARTWFARGQADLTGRDLLDLAASGEAALFGFSLERAAACLNDVFRFECRVSTHKDGERDVAISSSPVEFAGRRVRQLLIEDISERKRMEAQMLQNAKLATIGELSAGILHELAQPLNIARLTAQAALRGFDKGASPMAQFAAINSQMERMAAVIEHMRVFSRSDTGDETDFDVASPVTSAIKLVHDSFGADGIEIDANISSHAMIVRGRRIALEQVILNLMTNARDAIVDKAERDRSGLLRNEGRIAVNVRPENGSVIIEITDSGGGISDRVIDRVFAPFFTTKPAGRGTGLGLSVCQSIVESMKGEIRVRNAELGACFTVTLPQSNDAPIESEELHVAAVALTPALTGRLALIVEDEEEACELMADFLEEIGFDVLSANDAPSAMALCADAAPDLLISDIRLPGMNGIELAQKLRQMAPALPVIFVTGHFGRTEEIAPFDNDANARILHKPLDLVKLENAIGELVSVAPTKVLDVAFTASAA